MGLPSSDKISIINSLREADFIIAKVMDQVNEHRKLRLTSQFRYCSFCSSRLLRMMTVTWLISYGDIKVKQSKRVKGIPWKGLDLIYPKIIARFPGLEVQLLFLIFMTK